MLHLQLLESVSFLDENGNFLETTTMNIFTLWIGFLKSTKKGLF